VNKKFLSLSAALFVSCIEASQLIYIARIKNGNWITYVRFNEDGTQSRSGSYNEENGKYTASIKGYQLFKVGPEPINSKSIFLSLEKDYQEK
jgi:hypothetical protein